MFLKEVVAYSFLRLIGSWTSLILLVKNGVFGCTESFAHDFMELGIVNSLVDKTEPAFNVSCRRGRWEVVYIGEIYDDWVDTVL